MNDYPPQLLTVGADECQKDTISKIAIITVMTEQERIRRLRAALIICGRLVGGAIGDTCSDDFLCMIPDEVRGFVSKHSTCWPGSGHPPASELLDALRECTHHIDCVSPPTRDVVILIDRARAAIAKAVTPP